MRPIYLKLANKAWCRLEVLNAKQWWVAAKETLTGWKREYTNCHQLVIANQTLFHKWWTLTMYMLVSSADSMPMVELLLMDKGTYRQRKLNIPDNVHVLKGPYRLRITLGTMSHMKTRQTRLRIQTMPSSSWMAIPLAQRAKWHRHSEQEVTSPSESVEWGSLGIYR